MNAGPTWLTPLYGALYYACDKTKRKYKVYWTVFGFSFAAVLSQICRRCLSSSQSTSMSLFVRRFAWFTGPRARIWTKCVVRQRHCTWWRKRDPRVFHWCYSITRLQCHTVGVRRTACSLLRSLYCKISYLLAEEHWSHTNLGLDNLHMTQCAKIIVGFMANVGNVLSNVYKRFFYFLHVVLRF